MQGEAKGKYDSFRPRVVIGDGNKQEEIPVEEITENNVKSSIDFWLKEMFGRVVGVKGTEVRRLADKVLIPDLPGLFPTFEKDMLQSIFDEAWRDFEVWMLEQGNK